MKDENHKYEALDARFKLAAASIPVEFDPMAWESFSGQLDQSMGASQSKWKDLLSNIKLNILTGLIIDFIVLSGIMVVFVASMASNTPIIKEIKELPQKSQQMIPVLEEEDKDESENYNEIEADDVVLEDEKVILEMKESREELISDTVIIITVDSLKIEQDSLVQDSLDNQFIFWY